MTYKHHPIASIFPMMQGSELQELANDIKANGLKTPIVLLDDMVLDGRNRLAACELLKGKPAFVTYQGTDPVADVLSWNLHRRHLNETQRATVADKLARLPKGANQHTQICVSSQPAAAKALRVSPRLVQTVRAVRQAAPELLKEMEEGGLTANKALRMVKARRDAQMLKLAQDRISEEAKASLSSVCDLRNCSMQELLTSGIKPDAIITDPPYPKEFLPLYEELAALSKDIPLVAVMCGQSYLPEILSSMTKHLSYRWTLAYLTPGGQAVQLWDRSVNTFWKPVLLFGKKSSWLGDVCQSNANDKAHHHWGQSESGMADLVSRLTKPNQLVCDPFLGGGTTAIACLSLGRRFVGCDTSKESVDTATSRIHAHHANQAAL